MPTTSGLLAAKPKRKKEKSGRDVENTIRTPVKNKGEKWKETLIHTQKNKELDNISNL